MKTYFEALPVPFQDLIRKGIDLNNQVTTILPVITALEPFYVNDMRTNPSTCLELIPVGPLGPIEAAGIKRPETRAQATTTLARLLRTLMSVLKVRAYSLLLFYSS